MRIGVDIGGTFTDVVVMDDKGALRSWKVSSTPPNFEDGLINGVKLAAKDMGMSLRDLLGATKDFIHGTTVTTNTVLTRKGERVGLITTRGFGHTYTYARGYRGGDQDPSKTTHPVPLANQEDIEEVTERVDYAGRSVADLNEEELRAAVKRLVDNGVRSFAICFLWSFRNPEHEERAKKVVEEMAPGAYVSASFEACPVAGEYERTSTTVINAYAGPALKRYATTLDQRLRQEGLPKPLLLMKSDGGPATIDGAVTGAAQTVYSGPAAGVVASQLLGEQVGQPNLITFDMGGTSTDVALVYEGQLQTTSMQFLERQALATPMIDVTSVGAGGGSIGWTGVGETLRVGPQSAGAVPGPACYGRGGTEPAVTDANVILGLIDPDYFLGGQLLLQRSLSEDALQRLSQQVGLDIDRTAFGIFRVVNAVMADAIRLRTVYRGFDPREFTLVSFGGAGGLHCAAVAAELGIRRVVIPNMASVFSAVGLLGSDLTYSFAKSTVKPVGAEGTMDKADLAEINDIFSELTGRADASLDVHDMPADDRSLGYAIEMSYLGQILNFEIPAAASRLGQSDVSDLVKSFDDRYAKVYGPGAAAPEHGYTFKTYKVIGTGKISQRWLAQVTGGDGGGGIEPKSERSALIDIETGQMGQVPVYDGDHMRPGVEVKGSGIIEFWNTTVLVPSTFTARVDDHANVVLEQA